MRALRRRAPFGPIPAQTQRRSSRARRGLWPAFELLLRGGALPQADDTAVIPVPRPQGLSWRGRRAGLGDAERHGGGAGSPAFGACWREPPDDWALAGVVARGLCPEPILAPGNGRVHAAGQPGPFAGLAARSLFRRRRRTAHRPAAIAFADHWRRRGDTRCIRGGADPQKMPVAGGRDLFYGPARPDIGGASA